MRRVPRAPLDRRSCSAAVTCPRWPLAGWRRAAPTDTGSPAGAGEPGHSVAAAGKDVKTIYVAGGCFWGLEKYIGLGEGRRRHRGRVRERRRRLRRPTATAAATPRPCKVDYDPTVAPLPFLLDLFYDAIDPTSVNRQGNDVGTEYRTGIYYTDPADQAVDRGSRSRELQTRYGEPIAVESGPAHDLHARRGLPPGLPREEPRRLLPHPAASSSTRLRRRSRSRPGDRSRSRLAEGSEGAG